MCAILLSINPNHVENILNGSKKYEFRKKACKRHEDVLVDEPETIWKKTKAKSGIDKNFFDKYYRDRDQAVAYKLKNVIKYGKPKELKDFGVNSAPQSFQYID